MEKVNWFRRIFWSWSKFVEYFKNKDLEIEKESNQKLLDEKEKQINTLKDLIKSNDNHIETLHAQINEKKQDVQNLETKLQNVENSKNNEKALADQRDHSQIESMKEKEQQIQALKDSINKLQGENFNIKTSSDEIKKDIQDKLKTLPKIEKTFFASTGNKGRGELGEIQVKTILEKSGIESSFWTENLPVKSKRVEFAIKSGEIDKWIPIDAKTLEPELDFEERVIIDQKYLSKVKEAAKKISEYVSKPNTAGYGILVLQSDSIYFELYKEFPTEFQKIIRDNKIIVSSPSLFVQFAWTLSNIVNIYEKVSNHEKIYEDMISLLNSIQSFAKKIYETHEAFNVAMNRWYPAIENKHNQLAKKLERSGTIKEIPKIK